MSGPFSLKGPIFEPHTQNHSVQGATGITTQFLARHFLLSTIRVNKIMRMFHFKTAGDYIHD